MRRSAAPSPAGSVRSVNYATSPLLASRTPIGRSRLVVAAFALAFAVLLGRAAWVQVIDRGEILKEGDDRLLHTQTLPASRGRILDRLGEPLASSVPLQAVHVYVPAFRPRPKAKPPEIERFERARTELAQIVGLSPQALEEKLHGSRGTVIVRRHLDVLSWQRIVALRLPGVSGVQEFKRSYPLGEAAAHLVGFTDADDKLGVEGLERHFQQQLAGRAGQRTVVRDRLGGVVEGVGESQVPENGRDVRLSIDARLQSFAYQRLRDTVREHAALGGSVVALDVLTGELLAVANYPSFDPAKRSGIARNDAAGKGTAKHAARAGAAMRNSALMDTFEPGSTMKPFAIAQALDKGLVRPDTMIDTGNGSITIRGATIKDTHRHGVISVADVLAKSSNVGTIRLAMRASPQETWQTYTELGLGLRPALEFPRVAGGRLRPWERWREIEQASMSFGYALSASVLQMARAYSVFARDGELVPVTLLAREAAAAPVPGSRVYSPQTAQQMRQMLRTAVLKGGTGELAQAHAQGYSVAGKTGTARKREGKGYGKDYQSWFIGMAPATQPRIVVAVMVDAPSKGRFYGGTVAGPVFGQVVTQGLRLLGVPNDVQVQPMMVVDEAGAQQESY